MWSNELGKIPPGSRDGQRSSEEVMLQRLRYSISYIAWYVSLDLNIAGLISTDLRCCRISFAKAYRLITMAMLHQSGSTSVSAFGIFPPNRKNISAHRWLWDMLVHCVDKTREALMCLSDTTLRTYVWTEDSLGTLPQHDSSMKKMCRNFDDVRSFAKKNQMTQQAVLALKKSDSGFVWPHLPNIGWQCWSATLGRFSAGIARWNYISKGSRSLFEIYCHLNRTTYFKPFMQLNLDCRHTHRLLVK